MFSNRISRFFVEPEPVQKVSQASFASLPAFVVARQHESQAIAASNIYQAAWEQAQQQVAARHERERTEIDWN
jgi:tRNA A22 N-methylase